MSLSADGSALTYHLERDGKPRFTAVLEKVRSPEGAEPQRVLKPAKAQ